MNIAICGLLVVITAAIITDLKYNKIPNIICVFGIAVGLFWNLSIYSAPQALYLSLFGLFISGLILLPFYIMGGMAAGDVKLMASVGCILGGFQALEAALLSLICGSFLGIAVYILRGGLSELGELFGRYLFAVRCTVRTGRISLPSAGDDAISTSRFPYAIAIGTGSLLATQISLG